MRETSCMSCVRWRASCAWGDMYTVHELVHVRNVNTARDARVVAASRNRRRHVYYCMYRACACAVVRRARVVARGDASASHSNVELDREDD